MTWSNIKMSIRIHWPLILCVLCLILIFPPEYFSINSSIVGNDIEEHILQSTLMDGFFHTWWNENGVGGAASNMYYPPGILLFSWSTILIKIVLFLSLITLPLAFYNVLTQYFKKKNTIHFTTILLTYLLYDITHLGYYVGLDSLISGLFTLTLSFNLFLWYWYLLFSNKNLSSAVLGLLLAVIFLINPLMGIFGSIVTLSYLNFKRTLQIGVISIILTAWWLIPYAIYQSYSTSLQVISYFAQTPMTLSNTLHWKALFFVLSSYTVPILLFGILGLICMRKRANIIFYILTISFILFNTLGWHKRMSFMILILLVLSSGFLFEKLPRIYGNIVYVFSILLLCIIVLLVPIQFHTTIENIYDAPVVQKIPLSTNEGYYLTIQPPYSSIADSDSNVALSIFARSNSASTFRDFYPYFISQNASELRYLFSYFQITYIQSRAAGITQQYDFISPTNYSHIKKISIKEKYPIFVLNSSKEVTTSENYLLNSTEDALFENFQHLAEYVYNASIEGCIIAYAQNNNTVSFNTSCVGKPHIVKVSYHPLWKHVDKTMSTASFGNHFILVTPENEYTQLHFGPNWWMIILYFVAVIGVLTISFYAVFRMPKGPKG